MDCSTRDGASPALSDSITTIHQGTDYGFLVAASDLTRLFASAARAGAFGAVFGAVFGAGLGSIIRNVGGAVTSVVLVLFVIPPLAAQLVADAAPWTPTSLFTGIAGVSTDVSLVGALIAVVGAAAGHRN